MLLLGHGILKMKGSFFGCHEILFRRFFRGLPMARAHLEMLRDDESLKMSIKLWVFLKMSPYNH